MSETRSSSPAPLTPLHEDRLWSAVGAEWKQLGGSFRRHGFSFEWHDFRPKSDVDWGRTFHEESLEICLNLAGEGIVKSEGRSIEFRPRMAGFYVRGSDSLEARRRAHQRHAFITVEMSRIFLRQHLEGYRTWLHPVVVSMVDREGIHSAVGTTLPFAGRHQELLSSLRNPPVLLEAQVLWYRSKAIELAVELLFQPPEDRELFCARAKRIAHGRVEKVVALLRERMTEPPSLDELGKLVGCSPFYLSRTFSTEMGMTIQQFLRQVRLERSAELLRSGRFNVTEAAMEVGYSSLSHFSQAFHEHFGCCPGLYPVATVPRPPSPSSEKF